MSTDNRVVLGEEMRTIGTVTFGRPLRLPVRSRREVKEPDLLVEFPAGSYELRANRDLAEYTVTGLIRAGHAMVGGTWDFSADPDLVPDILSPHQQTWTVLPEKLAPWVTSPGVAEVVAPDGAEITYALKPGFGMRLELVAGEDGAITMRWFFTRLAE